jgi:hypothetical protein
VTRSGTTRSAVAVHCMPPLSVRRTCQHEAIRSVQIAMLPPHGGKQQPRVTDLRYSPVQPLVAPWPAKPCGTRFKYGT